MLKNARVLAECRENIFATEVIINGAFNPNVDGRTVNAVIGKQRDAVGNFIADAVYQLEFLGKIVVRKSFQFLQINRAARNFFYRVNQIFLAVGKSKPVQIFNRRRGNFFGTRKKINAVDAPSEFFTNFFDEE